MALLALQIAFSGLIPNYNTSYFVWLLVVKMQVSILQVRIALYCQLIEQQVDNWLTLAQI